MTVDTEQSSIRFTGIVDGVAVSAPFPVQATSEIKVYYDLDVLATEGVHYSVALTPPDYLTADVTPLAGFAVLSGGVITLNRELPYLQSLDIPTQAKLGSSRLEQICDRLTMIAQQLRDKLVRSLQFPLSDSTAVTGPLPLAAERANKLLGFDGTGKPQAVDVVTTGVMATAFGQAWLILASAATAMTALGFSAYMASLKATASLTALQTALGMSTFFKTLLAATDAAAFRVLISVYSIAAVDALLAPLTALFALRGAIDGFTYANNAGDVTNDIDVAAGACIDDGGVEVVTGLPLTKRSDAAWTVGNNGGFLDLIASAGNNDFDIYAIKRPDTAVVDYIACLSGTALTLPDAAYTRKRKVGWFARRAGAVVLFHTYQSAGGGLELAWDVPTLDVNLANTLTTARRTDPVKVPLTFATEAILNVQMNDAGAVQRAYICCPDQTDMAPSVTAAPLTNFTTDNTGGQEGRRMEVRTSVAGLIAARSTLATVDLYAVSTLGFKWSRR